MRQAQNLAANIGFRTDLADEQRKLLGSIDEEVRRYERLVELDSTLAGVRAGTVTAADPKAVLELAVFATRHKNWPYTAVKLAEKAFAAGSASTATHDTGHRLAAALAAAAAFSGRGDDARELDAVEKARLSKLALGWLRADLSAWTKRLETAPIEAHAQVEQTLRHWRAEADLATLRDEASLAKLPDNEREEWTTLWAEIEAVRQRAGGRRASRRITSELPWPPFAP
jgi:hypothetical protein